jgi:hypothetical protein
MAYSILSPESKQQLEQERSRLTQDRDNIIASVTAEIDRLIQHIDSLLGQAAPAVSIEASQPETSRPVAAKSNGSRKGKAKVASSATKAKAKISEAAIEEKPKKGKRKKQKLFDAKQLKAAFNDMTPTDALLHVMLQTPDQSFSTEEMIQELYDDFDEADLPRARKSVAGVFSRGMRFGKLEKIQEHPSRYRLVESA